MLDAATETDSENLKIASGACKPPLGIVPMAALVGACRVLEDGGAHYAPGNFLAQSAEAAIASYDSAFLRHRTRCQPLTGIVSPTSYTAPDDDTGLPHIDHMIAGLIIARAIMIRDGILAEDPGVGKRKAAAQTVRVTRTDPAADFAAIADSTEPRCYTCPFQDGGCNGCDHPERERLKVENDERAAKLLAALENDAFDEFGEHLASAALDALRFRAVDDNLQRLKAEARQAADDKQRRDHESERRR